MSNDISDIWILDQARENKIEKATLGLIGEARRLLAGSKKQGTVTVIALDINSGSTLEQLGPFGADKVIQLKNNDVTWDQGELVAEILFKLCQAKKPSCIFTSHSHETSDICPRLAALLETSLVTRVVDLKIDQQGRLQADRPVANGYLFEKIKLPWSPAPVITFLPSVLTPLHPNPESKVQIRDEWVEIERSRLKTKRVRVIPVDPDNRELEEADVIVVGGRGVGKTENFDAMHELARILGGSVIAPG